MHEAMTEAIWGTSLRLACGIAAVLRFVLRHAHPGGLIEEFLRVSGGDVRSLKGHCAE